MTDSKTNYGEAVFGYIITLLCILFFDALSDYTVWEAVYWFFGFALVVCILGWAGLWPDDNTKAEIAELELQIKKAELQLQLTELKKETA